MISATDRSIPTPIPRRRRRGRGRGRHRTPAAMVMGVVVTLAVAACGSSSDATVSTPAPAPPAVPPASIDRSEVDAAIDQLDGYVETMMSDTGAPGVAVAVVYQDEVLYAKGFGVRKVGEPDAVDTSTRFQLASVSKPVAASVVAAVVGAGGLSWVEPVKKYEPNFAVADPYVTDNANFTDLLSHRSGLPDHAGDLLEDLGYDYDEVISRLNQYSLNTFRDSYAYTNYGFTIAGNAAAKSQGKTWNDLSEEMIYEPLGMENTTSDFDEWNNSANHAYNHVLSDPTTKTWEAKYVRDAHGQAPAGGASSSVDDMAAWVRMELGGGKFEGRQIVDPAALQYTHQAHSFPHPATTSGARDSFYSTGINVATDNEGRVELAHAGAFALGASTNVAMLPSEQLGIVVLANTAPIGVAETISAEFMDYTKHGELTVDWRTFVPSIFEGMIEEGKSPTDYADPPADASAPQPIAGYVGNFSSPFYGPAQVVANGDDLVLKLGKELQLSYPLSHYDGNTLWFDTSGENMVGPTGALFTFADGTANSLTIEYFDAQGLGTFTRTPG